MTDQVTTYVATEISNMTEIAISDIDPAAPLNLLGLDSLQALQLLVLLERTYKVRLSDKDLPHFTSVNCIAELVVNRLGTEASEA